MSADDAATRLRALTELATPWAVAVAATLRLPDHVAQGATTVEALARCAGAHPAALARLVRHLVALGFFAAPHAGEIANTELSVLLLSDRGWRPWLDLDGAPGIWAESWPRLLDAVRSGSPDADERWYYEALRRTGRGAQFDELMARQVRANAQEVARVYDWSRVAHVVDVGGGTGTMLRTLLDAHPHLRATLFELPEVAARAEGAFAVVAGDVFVDALPRADAYVLSQIVHGFPDEQAAEILRRCEGGRVLLVETVLADDPSADASAFDLFMLTLTGGMQRTLDDFRRLAAAAGRELTGTIPLETHNTLLEIGAV